MSSRGVPQKWFCAGCKKIHPDSVNIEGDNRGEYWCFKSIKDGIKARRNDLPRYSETQFKSARAA